MNNTLKSRLSQFWNDLQCDLFPFLREEERLALTPPLEKTIRVLELIELERFIPSSRGLPGRPPKDRIALARAFVAKAVLNLPTTEALIDRLNHDRSLCRICGFDRFKSLPDASRFSRAFAEFSAQNLPARVHEALIRTQVGDQLFGHVAHDSTEIDAREKPAGAKRRDAKPDAEGVAPLAGPSEEAKPSEVPQAQEATPKKRGRPRKGEQRPKEPTVLERQVTQPVEQNLKGLPMACDFGTKKNSKGVKETWVGYKLHISTTDGDIPVSALLTSASLHDSQVAIPLMQMTGARIQYCYDLADAAYCSEVIREASRSQGRVPLIDHHPRAGKKRPFEPHEAERYKIRSQVERTNSLLKDAHGGRQIRVRGAPKVYTHLMFGILVIAAEPIMRLLS